jgi:hypothetical protein
MRELVGNQSLSLARARPELARTEHNVMANCVGMGIYVSR